MESGLEARMLSMVKTEDPEGVEAVGVAGPPDLDVL